MSLETPNAFADEENILLHTALFKQVSPAEAEELLPHLKHATFDKGDYIFSEGDTDLHEAHRLDSDLRSDAGGCDAARRLELDGQQRICGRRFGRGQALQSEVHSDGHCQLQCGGEY